MGPSIAHYASITALSLMLGACGASVGTSSGEGNDGSGSDAASPLDATGSDATDATLAATDGASLDSSSPPDTGSQPDAGGSTPDAAPDAAAPADATSEAQPTVDAAADAPIEAGGPHDASTDVSPDTGSPPPDAPGEAAPDSSGAPDAGADVVHVPDPPDPGAILCGSTVCDLDASLCCTSNSTCVASIVSCPGEWTQQCDETADCPSGQFCGVVANAPLETTCTSTAYEPRVCKSNAECPDGGVCVTQSCDTGFGGSPGVWVSTCGPLPWCVAHP